MYEYAQITVFDIFLSTSLVLGYSASLSAILVYRLSVAFLVKDLPAFGFQPRISGEPSYHPLPWFDVVYSLASRTHSPI